MLLGILSIAVSRSLFRLLKLDYPHAIAFLAVWAQIDGRALPHRSPRLSLMLWVCLFKPGDDLPS